MSLHNLYAGLRAENGTREVSFYRKNIASLTRITSRESTSLGTGITVTPARKLGINLRFAIG